jgi:hypothetical protein
MRASLGRAVLVSAGIALAQTSVQTVEQPKPMLAKPVIQTQREPTVQRGDQKQRGAPAPGCGNAFTIPDQSFRALDKDRVRDASVWVDDIDSGLLSGFDAFKVFVVTGRLYAPFQLTQGRLERQNFVKYTTNNYNTLSQGPLTLSDQQPQGELSFTQDGRQFRIKVSNVHASTFGHDTVSVQLCW